MNININTPEVLNVSLTSVDESVFVRVDDDSDVRIEITGEGEITIYKNGSWQELV